MNKRHYEHTLPNIRGSLSNTYGTTGPVHISKLLNPIQEICRHPDRNRLLAEFFSEY